MEFKEWIESYHHYESSLMTSYFVSRVVLTESSSADNVSDVTLSVDELNAMQYVGGYVVRQLLRHYEKKSGEVYGQYISCLVVKCL